MSISANSCAMCHFCREFVYSEFDGTPRSIWYCRHLPPVPSTKVVAASESMVITKGMWPTVDPDLDSCSQFVESEFV